MATIIKRHKKGCPSHDGKRCGCAPSFQVRVKPNGRAGKAIVKTFPTNAAAKTWAAETEAAKRKGLLPSQNRAETVREAGTRLIEDMRAGIVRTRKGGLYKPRAIE